MALSDSSSTQDFFSEPTSVLEGSRKPFAEKRLAGLSAQAGPTGKDLPGPPEERGKKPNLLHGTCFDLLGQSKKNCGLWALKSLDSAMLPFSCFCFGALGC